MHGIDNIGLNMPVGGSHGYSTELPVGLLGLVAHTGVAQFVSYLGYHSNLTGILTSGKVVEVKSAEQHTHHACL